MLIMLTKVRITKIFVIRSSLKIFAIPTMIHSDPQPLYCVYKNLHNCACRGEGGAGVGTGTRAGGTTPVNAIGKP